MKYRNASEIFPDDLLKEIQKYTDGELVYIPKTKERQNCGDKSGARTFYQQRNEEIRQKFRHNHRRIDELSEEYGLSIETIRKILYR